MPGNLADLMGLGAKASSGPTPPIPGSMPGAPAGGTGGGGAAPGTGNLANMMKSMPASGIKGLASSVVAIVIKVLEMLLMAYGTESQEGKTLLGAIRSLSKMSKGQQTGDIQSVVRSLISALPQDMQNTNPGDITKALSELMGKGGGGGPGGAPPGGPGQSMMPPGANPGAIRPM